MEAKFICLDEPAFFELFERLYQRLKADQEIKEDKWITTEEAMQMLRITSKAIDQPEDNLDSEFIAKHIVENLKKIKETRQVIIVTHNANIAVLGDAELIIPLKSTSIKSHVIDLGSIDRSETRAICCKILEGGDRAFKKRREIYGF